MSDPQKFNDPIAEQTEWDWIVSGGSNFHTHKLIHQSNGDIRFKPTGGKILFAVVFY